MSGVLRRNVLFWLNLLLLAPLAAATVAGFGGAYWWPFDLFSHFRVQYCVIAALVLLLFLLFGARRPALIAGLTLLTNAVPVAILCLPQVQVASATPGAYGHRVLMMNVYRKNPQVQRILAHVRQQNPDVLILEEITDAWVKPLKGLEARYPFRWVHPGGALTGIAVFSRSMPLETRLLHLSSQDKPSLLLTLGVGPNAEQRISVLATHFHPPTARGDAQVRNQELSSLARVAREHIWPLVVVGDLNISPFSPLFNRALSDGGLKSCDRGGLHPTWPTWAPWLAIQIDHCLATEGVITTDFKVGPSMGSDHRAISVKFSPVPRPPNG